MNDLLIFAALVFLLSVFVFFKKKHFTVEKVLFHLVYVIMYRSGFGLGFANSVARRLRAVVRVLGFVGIFVGFVSMVFIAYTLVKGVYGILFASAPSSVALVLPVDVAGAVHVPVFYWVICIFVLAVVHEFSHAIVARAYNIRVKHSGFAFLCFIFPVLPLAFVEPDEKDLQRRSARQQLSVFAAGSFANIVLGLFCTLLLVFSAPVIASNVLDDKGVLVAGFTKDSPAELSGIKAGDVIVAVDNKTISDVAGLSSYLSIKSPNDTVSVRTNASSYPVTLSSDAGGKAVMGIYLSTFTEIKQSVNPLFASVLFWFVGLLYWLSLLNVGVGMFNLVPLGPVDGGRMLQVVLKKFLKGRRALAVWRLVSIFFFAVILFSILSSFFK